MPVETPLIKREDNSQLKSLASIRKESHESTGTFNFEMGKAFAGATEKYDLEDEKASNSSVSCYIPLSMRKKGESPFMKFLNG
ncbi:uncharacterized protein E5676_scaffold16G00240 [Cucumis melo var. makuwa]|uniref:Uncharacterized protein n=1 Tax=Cucumis melo var. makuwa TaxID=1194695 RepID=A0A5D3CDK1_CUCMM|nr:uncharacterized protein E5676_scaffold16G00240 [Cucumis melo var. makuwa]